MLAVAWLQVDRPEVNRPCVGGSVAAGRSAGGRSPCAGGSVAAGRSVGGRSFCVVAMKLPNDLRKTTSLTTFKSKLKTFLFGNFYHRYRGELIL